VLDYRRPDRQAGEKAMTEEKFIPFQLKDAADDTERLIMFKWYARQLAQGMRDRAEFPFEHDTQATIDANRWVAHHIDMIFEEWPSKWTGWTNKHKPEWAENQRSKAKP
jgi:hypothetical protein